MLIRTHIGVSLDGFVATPDGLPAWDAVPTFVPGESHGYPEFIEQCDAIVIGRNTFDFGHAYWTEQGVWPWAGRRGERPVARWPAPSGRREQAMGTGGLSKARLGRMRDVMAGHIERGAAPGIVTLVSRRGEVHVEAIGTQAVGGGDPMRRDTIF